MNQRRQSRFKIILLFQNNYSKLIRIWLHSVIKSGKKLSSNELLDDWHKRKILRKTLIVGVFIIFSITATNKQTIEELFPGGHIGSSVYDLVCYSRRIFKKRGYSMVMTLCKRLQYTISHFLLSTVLYDSYYYSHFTNEETGHNKIRHLPQIIQQ